MPSMQEQARALGNSTRHGVFRAIADAGHPIGIAELTTRFDINHNAIRQHLAKLVTAGLVIESRAEASGPGRPRSLYALAPSVEGTWGISRSCERLSRLLVEIIRSGTSPRDVGRASADQFRMATSTGDVVADIAAVMAREGFEPDVAPLRGGADITLKRCPFQAAASVDRAIVCAIHLGLAEGLATGTNVVVKELVANDPRQADCRLKLRTTNDDRAHPPGRLSLRGRIRRK